MITIDHNVYREHLTRIDGCSTCSMTIRKATVTVCPGCIMKTHCKQGVDQYGNPKYGCTLKVDGVAFMNQFSLKKRNEIGKCQAFMYLYYPEFNYILPNAPEKDILGKFNEFLFTEIEREKGKLKGIKYRKLKYVIHHIDGNHDNDSEENLALVLNSEHTSLHTKQKYKPGEREKFIQDIQERNIIHLGYHYWGV